MATPRLPSGVLAAALTPMTDDGHVSTEALADHVTWLLAHGCDGVLLFGTNGEGLSLTAEERIDVLATVLGGDIPSETILVGASAPALPDAVDLAREATERNAGGVLVLPPFHYQNVKSEGVFRFYDQLVQHVGSGDLRLYLDHFAELSGVPISFGTLQRLAEKYPDQIAGITDSDGEWDHTDALCRDFPNLQVFTGTERLLLPTLEAGGAGCISGTANVTASLAAEVFSRWRDGADAASLQDTLTRFRTAFAPLPTIPALKYLMSQLRARAAWSTVRPPLVSLSTDEKQQVDQLATELENAVVLPSEGA